MDAVCHMDDPYSIETENFDLKTLFALICNWRRIHSPSHKNACGKAANPPCQDSFWMVMQIETIKSWLQTLNEPMVHYLLLGTLSIDHLKLLWLPTHQLQMAFHESSPPIVPWKYVLERIPPLQFLADVCHNCPHVIFL